MSIRGFAFGAFIFNILITITLIVLVVFLLCHPEVIGAFFGKIAHGFNSVK
jgi:hypothetical protein